MCVFVGLHNLRQSNVIQNGLEGCADEEERVSLNLHSLMMVERITQAESRSPGKHRRQQPKLPGEGGVSLIANAIIEGFCLFLMLMEWVDGKNEIFTKACGFKPCSHFRYKWPHVKRA